MIRVYIPVMSSLPVKLAIRGVRRDEKMPFSDIGHYAEEIAMWQELPFHDRGDMLTVYFYRSSEQKKKKEEPERTVVFFQNSVQDLKNNDLNRLAFQILKDRATRWKTEHGMYNKYYYKTHIFTAAELEALDAGDSI